MSKKTKELLDNLNKITEKPKNRFEGKPTIPDTNRLWKSQLAHESIHKWPAIYHKGPWTKVVDDDGTIDYWTPFDRVYGGMYGQRIIQKDGTQYQGKVYNKFRLIKGVDGKKFRSQCTITADGRWFDNGGFPIDPPKDLEPEKVKTKEELEEEAQQKAEIAKRKEQEILANLK